MKQIPNLFTLLNLVFGCLAIVAALQYGLTFTIDSNGGALVVMPEKIFMASVFIGCAAVVDFLDGFVARLFKATSEMGKQLDSLADIVSFGVAPSLIIFQFLRLGFAQEEDGLSISMLWLLPAFILACAAAWRLARFNITASTGGFTGMPTPAAGLFIATFPLVYWNSGMNWVTDLCLNHWFWYAVIFIVSWLMVSKLPMLALKFSGGISVKKLLPFIIIAAVTIVAAFLVGWLAAPACFLMYVLLSLLFKQA